MAGSGDLEGHANHDFDLCGIMYGIMYRMQWERTRELRSILSAIMLTIRICINISYLFRRYSLIMCIFN